MDGIAASLIITQAMSGTSTRIKIYRNCLSPYVKSRRSFVCLETRPKISSAIHHSQEQFLLWGKEGIEDYGLSYSQ